MFRLILVAAVIALFAYVGWLWFDEDSEFGELPDVEAAIADLQEADPFAALAGADPVVEPEAATVDAASEDETPLDAPLAVAPPEGAAPFNSEADEPAREGEWDEPAETPAGENAAETADEAMDTGDDQPPAG